MANLQPFEAIIDRWRQANGVLDEEEYDQAVLDFCRLVDPACWESITHPEVHGGLSVYSITATIEVTDDIHGQLTRWFDPSFEALYNGSLWWVWLYIPPQRLALVRRHLGDDEAAMLTRGRTWLNGGVWGHENDFPLPTGKLGREPFLAGWAEPIERALAVIIEGQLPATVHQRVLDAKDHASRRLLEAAGQAGDRLRSRPRVLTQRRRVGSAFLQDWTAAAAGTVEQHAEPVEDVGPVRMPTASPLRFVHATSGPSLAQQTAKLTALRDQYVCLRDEVEHAIEAAQAQVRGLCTALAPDLASDEYAAAERYATTIVDAARRGLALQLPRGSTETIDDIASLLQQLHDQHTRLEDYIQVAQLACAAIGGHEYLPVPDGSLRCVHCHVVDPVASRPATDMDTERSGT
jgi:hypothetical protein